MEKTDEKRRSRWKRVLPAAAFGFLFLLMAAQCLYVYRELQTLRQAQRVQEQDVASLGDALGVSVSHSSTVTASWAGKTWVSYGDSITQMGGWQDYITEYFGFAEHFERGLGSCTFVQSDQIWYANPDGSYNSRYGFLGVTEAPEGTTAHEGYMCSTDRITTSIPADADLILVMAGTNDAGITVSAPLGDLSYPFDETTFKGAVASTVVKLQERAPKALIVLASPLSGRGPETEDKKEQTANRTEPEYNHLGLTTQDYADAIREVAEYLSIPYIDVFGSTGINSFNRNQYIGDIVHPNEEGQKAMARVMIGALDDLKPVEKKEGAAP